jgi:hypothetical protein
VPKPSTADGRGHRAEHRVELRLDDFAREAVEQESARLGVSAEEVMTFAVLYYLADLDSGRIARDISTSPLGASHRSASSA